MTNPRGLVVYGALPVGLVAVAGALAHRGSPRIQAPTVRIEAAHASIPRGGSTELSWAVTGATAVFISHLGTTPLEGRRVISPTETSTYALVAEGAGGFASASVTVTVTNAKGDADYPDPRDYHNRYSYRAPSPSLPALLERIHDVLQNRLRFSVREVQERDSSFVFHTIFLPQPELVLPTEGHIAARRLSYRVTVSRRPSRSAPFPYTVEALIQYRRRLEQEWRYETDALMHEAQARKLEALITP